MHQASGRSPEQDELMCYLALFLYEEQEVLVCQPDTGEQLQTTDPNQAQTIIDEFSGERDLLLHSYLDRVQAQAQTLALGSVPQCHQQRHLWGKRLAAGAAQQDSR